MSAVSGMDTLADEGKPSSEPESAAKTAERSYLQIFKSSAIIAGSSMVTIFFSIVRNKSAALWLGPEGVGLMGLFNAIIDLAMGLAGSGLAGSGVRQIAEANETGDAERVAKTAAALKWLALALGLCGALLLVVFARPVASITFGDATHVTGVALIAAAVFLKLLASGQTALLQGLRRIGELAKVNIIAAFFGVSSFVAMIWMFGKDGIVPAIIMEAAILALIAWLFARRATPKVPGLPVSALSAEAGEMLRLGLVFMVNGLFMLGATYAVRIIVTHESGIAAAGLYQAAWALASLYAGFILQAMGVDFYPRLTAAAHNNAECNRLVNEQTQVSMLLAGPGLIATLTLAPFVVHLFYSPEFSDAVTILRWFCVGMMLRVIVWPMGFIVLAKNEQRIFFWTELAAASVQVGLAWLLVQKFGPAGAGMAFFGLYLWHSLLIGFIVWKLTGFRWSMENARVGLAYLVCTTVVCFGFWYLDEWAATTLGIAMTAACSLHSLYGLLVLLPADRLPSRLRRMLARRG